MSGEHADWVSGGAWLPHEHDPIERIEDVLTYLGVVIEWGDPVIVDILSDEGQLWLRFRGALRYAGHSKGDSRDPLPCHVFDIGEMERGDASDHGTGGSFAIYEDLFERGSLETLDDSFFALAVRQRGLKLVISDSWGTEPHLGVAET